MVNQGEVGLEYCIREEGDHENTEDMHGDDIFRLEEKLSYNLEYYIIMCYKSGERVVQVYHSTNPNFIERQLKKVLNNFIYLSIKQDFIIKMLA